jgi:exodeoxyribonuclease VII large subunit
LLHLRSRLRNPAQTLGQQRSTLNELQRRLQKAEQLRIDTAQRNLSALQQRLAAQHPAWQVQAQRLQLKEKQKQVSKLMQSRLNVERGRLNQYQRLLASLGPENTLSRGYAIVQDGQGNVLRSASQTAQGEQVNIRLASGRVSATVDETNDT